MNITQRKFAITRIHASLLTKVAAIEKEDVLKLESYNKSLIPTNEEIYNALINCTLPLKKKIDFSTLINSKCISLNEFFDLTKMQAACKRKALKGEQPIYNTIYMHNRKALIFTKPGEPSTNTTFYITYLSNIARINKIQAALNKAVDIIMLGDEEDTLNAIHYIERSKF